MQILYFLLQSINLVCYAVKCRCHNQWKYHDCISHCNIIITGRLLQNNGKHLLWDHVVALYKEDASRALYRTELTEEHVYLTPHSVMRVNLADQVGLEIYAKYN